jgi:hypothetical protein
MEKGFNDDELADIMNEIETLEQEFEADVEQEEQEESTSPEQEMQSIEDEVDGAFKPEEMNAVLEDLAEMPEEDSVPVSEEQPVDNVHQMQEPMPKHPQMTTPSHHGAAHSQMSFNVSGDMTLDLNFKFGSEDVHIWVDENQGFVIEMNSGAKFTIPVVQKNKKAA